MWHLDFSSPWEVPPFWLPIHTKSLFFQRPSGGRSSCFVRTFRTDAPGSQKQKGPGKERITWCTAIMMYTVAAIVPSAGVALIDVS